MDIKARIRRRRDHNAQPQFIQRYEALSPAAHLDEPVGRGQLLEQLLDYFDPVFDGELPPNGYVYGPIGSGKSAVLTSLLSHLKELPEGVTSRNTRGNSYEHSRPNTIVTDVCVR
jgi:Cdc6-like AAA superfamily ATPase